MRVISITKPTISFQDGQNITKNDHKIINMTPQKDNTVMIYNEITK